MLDGSHRNNYRPSPWGRAIARPRTGSEIGMDRVAMSILEELRKGIRDNLVTDYHLALAITGVTLAQVTSPGYTDYQGYWPGRYEQGWWNELIAAAQETFKRFEGGQPPNWMENEYKVAQQQLAKWR